MTVDMGPLLCNPILLKRNLKIGSEPTTITEIIKYIQQEGKGKLPFFNDRIVHNIEIRYSNGLLYDFKTRKESK